MQTSKSKGNILEDLVALLHQGGSGHVEVRTRLTSALSSARQREVDVMLTSYILGFPIRTVIECKNHRGRIGIQLIDGFAGFLDDLGVPKTHGIFVSPIGFSKDAEMRAADVGIRTLLFSGLTPDRLNAAVNSALQSVVYRVATWRQLSRFEYAPPAAAPGPGIAFILDPTRHGDGEGAVLNALWEAWTSGVIPSTLGEHTLWTGHPKVGYFIAEVEVTAHVAVLKGSASRLTLMQSQSGAIERLRINAEFEKSGSSVELLRFATEADLATHLASASIHVQSNVRVPRLVSTHTYWPPSNDAVARIRQLIERKGAISFENVEGRNLLNAWANSLSINAEAKPKRQPG